MVSKDVEVYAVPVERIRQLRHDVLRAGKPLDASVYIQDALSTTTHLAAVIDGRVVGCATLFPEPHDGEPAWRLRGMATDPAYRNQGIGSRLLSEIVQRAATAGVALLWCNARSVALPFYLRLGFSVQGEEFLAEGVPHFRVSRGLDSADSRDQPAIPTVRLNDGTTIPALGFGTYLLNGQDAIASVSRALGLGYRLLDSAVNYRNEREVGRAVSQAGDDDVVVTTKIPGRDHGYDETMRSFEGSVSQLGRVDLYLIHWPNPRVGRYVDTWQAMVDLQRQGRVRSIGVSNFTERQLREVADVSGVVPAVNQVELHPHLPQVELRRVHDELGIVTESWSPFGEGRTFDHPAVTEPADKYGRTPAQVVLRWHLQLGAVPLPKSATPERQRENINVFDFTLTESEVAAITALGRPDGRLWGGDPETNEEM